MATEETFDALVERTRHELEARGELDPNSPDPEVVAAAVMTALRRDAADLVAGLHRRRRKMLSEHEHIRRGFERRLGRIWGPGLDALESVCVVAYEAGELFNSEEWKTAATEDPRLVVLVRTHARACLVASEILALLRSGHASGALGRWRTLHELAVVALFIKDHDAETAERYIVHADVRALRRVETYQKHAEALGEEPLTAEEERAVRARRDEVLANVTNPRAFESDWGWAGAAMGKLRPSFGDLVDAVDLDHWGPWVDLAHYPVHASSSAMTVDIGNDGDWLLAGPSNAGLATIGHMAAISLQLASVALLQLRPTPSRDVTLLALRDLVSDVGDAFDQGETEYQRRKAEESNRPWWKRLPWLTDR